MPGKIEVVKIDADGVQSVKLKKWSMLKCVAFLGEIGSISDELGDNLNVGESMSNQQLFQLIVSLGKGAIAKATKIIHESIQEPRLSEDQILEWDPDDFIRVGTKIIEMNFTDSLIKNFDGLKSAAMKHLPKGMLTSDQKTASPAQ
jgi:hypothetical protein